MAYAFASDVSDQDLAEQLDRDRRDVEFWQENIDHLNSRPDEAEVFNPTTRKLVPRAKALAYLRRKLRACQSNLEVGEREKARRDGWGR